PPTLSTPPELLGRRIFDVFTDLPDDADSSGALGLHASLERVRSQGVADAMAVRTYELRRRGPNRSKEQRYWRTVHSPVFDKDGGVSHIRHNIEDVTAVGTPGANATPYAPPPERARARALVDAKLAHDRNPHLLAELRE